MGGDLVDVAPEDVEVCCIEVVVVLDMLLVDDVEWSLCDEVE